MGGPGSGRKKGSGGGKSKGKKGMVKVKLGKNKPFAYKVDDLGKGGRVVKSSGWKNI
jgi:hypothetical protein